MAGVEMRALVWLVSASLAACAAQVATPRAPVAQPEPTQPAPEPVSEPVSVAPAATDMTLVTTTNTSSSGAEGDVLGVIERGGLVAIIDAGLGRLFQRLQVSPSLKKGRFVGFQITSLHPDWAVSTLQAGDVVTALNGMPIERPEQAMAAFESLRTAEQLAVELLRAGTPVTLRYRIE